MSESRRVAQAERQLPPNRKEFPRAILSAYCWGLPPCRRKGRTGYCPEWVLRTRYKAWSVDGQCITQESFLERELSAGTAAIPVRLTAMNVFDEYLICCVTGHL